ncbi:Mbeg1-like protein [Lactobacillus acetotolerans]|uniref:Mbeg1-like protein n=1 Tax=Lactobacillus acetotolerans TaxID=1600 RepID=UPI001451EB20|nr:Mbeg1-like protein [Lactobacillus acetotolerans]QJD73682.1 DUF2974 domain-containing protein [Lactobacillus acetotolerans]
MYPDNNICSYLKWRGDIGLNQSPFNEVDALVLSIFSYLDLPDIVPDNEKTITVQEAAKQYFAPGHPTQNNEGYKQLLKLMAKANRFKNAKLSYFINTLTDQTQFSAIKIQLANNTNFISFRGTDDSLVGWKEDFEISFKKTSAQQKAVEYLTRIMKNDDENYLLGGHSKGGNLAEYAALNVEPKMRNRIKKIYTYDAPGIAQEVGNQLPSKYLHEVLDRYVPEYSIIGRLFEPEGIEPTIVSSSRKTLSQHDAFSWEITGSHFVTKRYRNPQSRLYNQLLNQWIGTASLKERESLVNDLFSALSFSGAKKINELGKNGFGGFGAILLSLTDSSRRTKFVFGSLINAIWEMLKNLHLGKLLFSTDSIIGWIMVILGIVDLITPQYSIRAFGALVAFAGITFSVKQILQVAESELHNRQKQFFIISYLVIFALSVALISNNRLLIFLAHYFLGIFLIIYSYLRLRRIIVHNVPGIFQKIIVFAEAIIAFALGIIMVVNPSYFDRKLTILIGILLIAYGFFKLVAELFNQRKKIPKRHR